jgi:hypothetical protein
LQLELGLIELYLVRSDQGVDFGDLRFFVRVGVLRVGVLVEKAREAELHKALLADGHYWRQLVGAVAT